ncbi:uncharacterized protein LOC132550411 [Ylistrum balloti]|uniref:uncharacterized protein LOC132550411 n=1 Tax=Ylistrum balloti TaxID=509963 RepID=UPI002905DBAD|nr:uncharacterized protein LOC132550411 [Ylistrum balloti]
MHANFVDLPPIPQSFVPSKDKKRQDSMAHNMGRDELQYHPDRQFVKYLVEGLTDGFDTLVNMVTLPTKECNNLLSARSQPDVVDRLIESEVNKGFLCGPFAFGCRSSPKIFDTLSEAVCWIAKNNYGIRYMLHLLDDFITFEEPGLCGERNMALLHLIFNRLNIPMAKHKTCGLEIVIEYLRIVLDSHNMQTRLPKEKLDRICKFLQAFLVRMSCTKRELLQLLGHLNFANGQISTVGSTGTSTAMQSASLVRGFMGLQPVISELWHAAIAPNTRAAYQTGFNLFLQFLLMAGITASVSVDNLTVTEDILMYFVAHCYNSNLAHSTIKLYICGIQFTCLRLGIKYPSNVDLPRLWSILGGVKRRQGKRTRLCYPVTFSILKEICTFLRLSNMEYVSETVNEDLVLETVCTIAFFGFLRCGEFTVLSDFDPTLHLCIGDLVIGTDCVLLTLKMSDPFRKGVTIRLFKNNTQVCPYEICCKYMKHRLDSSPSCDDPLFVMRDGKALTRNVFIAKFKHILECIGVNAERYNGHSFRIGAATTAASVHLEDHLIKVLGRWSSDAYCRYIRTPIATIKEAQIALTTQ